MAAVHIVLATYNGDRFLAEQLGSLVAQSEPDWSLLVMDDGSSDRTPAIIDGAARNDGRVVRLPSPATRTGSAAMAFNDLLTRSLELGGDYVFCCDQDDVWHQDKLRLVLAELRATEGESRVPTLIHHDLEVVDSQLLPVAESFWVRMGFKPGSELIPQRLLSRNEVTGCALACNRALLEAALPIPDAAIMHDWWLALCAAYLGRLRPMPARLVKYRQHGGNAIGAKSVWFGLDPRTNWVAGWRRGDADFLDTVRQAQAFQERMSGRVAFGEDAARALNLYRQLPTLTLRERLAALHKARFWRGHWLLDALLALRVLFLPRPSD
jgi:glycosyltransferase involved in cell wall biosynthesis